MFFCRIFMVPSYRLDYIKSELMAPGEISFTSDPQLGKAGL